MGLTGAERLPLPPSDPSRPPRLSRRDRDYYCFHLDFSAESQHLLPSLTRYVIAYGAKYSAFLDINVTHIITDKPIHAVQSSSLVRKIGCKILTLSDFLQKICDSYDRVVGRLPARPPMSPTLVRAAAEMRHTKDLSRMLEEENRRLPVKGVMRASRAITPLYNANGLMNIGRVERSRENVSPAKAAAAAAATDSRYLGVVGDKRVVYEPFRHPYVLLEEATYTFAPVHKEYPAVSETGQATYPMMHIGSQEYHCPWVSRHTGPNQGHPAMELDQRAMGGRSRPVLVVTQRHRAAKAVRTLAQHRAITEQAAAARPKHAPRAMGRAPLPPIHAPSGKAPADRPRPGFCECCYEKYTHLERHVRRDSHRRLVGNADFYRSVDRVLWTIARPIATHPLFISSNGSSNLSGAREAPLSPAKSIISSNPTRVKSIPFKNITNQMPPPPAGPSKPANNGLDVVDIGSDSPIYSSPSLKRRRSQRLVGRPRISGKFIP